MRRINNTSDNRLEGLEIGKLSLLYIRRAGIVGFSANPWWHSAIKLCYTCDNIAVLSLIFAALLELANNMACACLFSAIRYIATNRCERSGMYAAGGAKWQSKYFINVAGQNIYKSAIKSTKTTKKSNVAAILDRILLMRECWRGIRAFIA